MLQWSLAGAWAGVATAARAADPADDPAAVIRALDDALLACMKLPPGTPFASREAALRPVIERAYALPVVLRAAVGLRFASFPAAQQATLLDAFTRFTVASYVTNFSGLDGVRFEVTPVVAAGQTKVVVPSRIVPRGAEPTAINYVMQRDGAAGAGWQIVDVLLAGTISRVAVQRSDFRNLIVPGNAQALIASLNAKVAALENGQKS